MKIKLSQKQWKEIGKAGGWLKKSAEFNIGGDMGVAKNPNTRSEDLIALITNPNTTPDILKEILNNPSCTNEMANEINNLINPNITASAKVSKLKKTNNYKFAQEGQLLNPDFNIREFVKDEDTASKFIGAVMMDTPWVLPKFLGVSDRELIQRIKNGIKTMTEEFAPNLQERIEKMKIDDLKTALDIVLYIVDNLLRMGGSQLYGGVPSILLPLLGFKSGTNDVVKRLYDYVPIAIKEENVEENLGDFSEGDKKSAIDSILDRFNRKEIDKSSMENLLKEFAKNKNCFKK